MAVGTCLSEMARICSPKPGRMRSHTAAVASGVMSRGAGPVPPVVITRQHPMSSTSSINVCSTRVRSSGTTRTSACHSESSASSRNASTSGPERSAYSPELALSLTVTTPTRAMSPPESGLPPAGEGPLIGRPSNSARFEIRGSANLTRDRSRRRPPRVPCGPGAPVSGADCAPDRGSPSPGRARAAGWLQGHPRYRC